MEWVRVGPPQWPDLYHPGRPTDSLTVGRPGLQQINAPYKPRVTSIRAISWGVRSIRTESPSIGRSTISSSWKSVWRAQTGLRKSPEAAAGGAAGGLEQVEDDAPAAAVAGGLGVLDVGDGDGLVVDLEEPAGRPGRGRPGLGRDDEGRGDEVERGVERVLEVERHAQAEASAPVSRPATRSVSSIRGPWRRWWARPPKSRAVRWRRVEMSSASGVSGRSASVSSGGEQARCGGASSSGRARPSGRRGSAPRDRPAPARRARRGRGRSSVTSSSRIGRPVQSR